MPGRWENVAKAHALAREALLAERAADGSWTGRLSASAIATAVALAAFARGGAESDHGLILGAAKWLNETQNADGGWGDSPESPSNLSATLLVRAAFALGKLEDSFPEAVAGAERYLTARAGASPRERTAAVLALYGKDRTFAVPILALLALAGAAEWRDIPPLPFELACLPRALLDAVDLKVVGYALPALIAIGLLLHRQMPSRNPMIRLLRNFAAPATLEKLRRIQPASGGFLEAQPLSAFVALALSACGLREHAVTQNALRFLRATARPDGSWPIDTNLSVWLTTSAAAALVHRGGLPDDKTAAWVRARQLRARHPFTGAAPGGWAWTDLPGGVPDADDTAGALVFLAGAGKENPGAIYAGLRWLLDLQNAEGGWPTFCRGRTGLPFDASSPDLTAHALRALAACGGDEASIWRSWFKGEPLRATRALASGFFYRLRGAAGRGFSYLSRTQRPDGSWLPLWFGSQRHGGRNPVLGTARVLRAWTDCGRQTEPEAIKGLGFLLAAQNRNGGWGAAPGVESTVEETALAAAALCDWYGHDSARYAYGRGADYLAARVIAGLPLPAEPLGLYFASLWYSEKLYPLLWTVEALGRVLQVENALVHS